MSKGIRTHELKGSKQIKAKEGKEIPEKGKQKDDEKRENQAVWRGANLHS